MSPPRRRRAAGRASIAVAAGAALCAAGPYACRKLSDEPTSLSISVSTDLTPVNEVTAIVVDVQTRTGAKTVSFPIASAADLPATLGLLPGPDVDTDVTVTATARFGSSSVLAQTKVTRFVVGHAATLEMSLTRACLTVSCPSDQTCERGSCIDRHVPPSPAGRGGDGGDGSGGAGDTGGIGGGAGGAGGIGTGGAGTGGANPAFCTADQPGPGVQCNAPTGGAPIPICFYPGGVQCFCAAQAVFECNVCPATKPDVGTSCSPTTGPCRYGPVDCTCSLQMIPSLDRWACATNTTGAGGATTGGTGGAGGSCVDQPSTCASSQICDQSTGTCMCNDASRCQGTVGDFCENQTPSGSYLTCTRDGAGCLVVTGPFTCLNLKVCASTPPNGSFGNACVVPKTGS